MRHYLLISFVIGFTSYILIQSQFCTIQDVANKKKEVFLLIGIMSSQNHFEARQSLRNTWLNFAEEESVKYLFLVGENICDIHPEDRIYQESCLEWTVDFHNRSSKFSTGEINSIKTKSSQKKIVYVGFTFIVHHSIVLRSLNILNDFVNVADDFVRVSLINSISREKIVSATFIKHENNSSSRLLEKSVEPYVLPKGFEAEVILEITGSKVDDVVLGRSECKLQWNNASGLISFLQLIRSINEKPVTFHNRSCSHASLTFSIHEIGELQSHVATRAKRRKTWEIEIKLLKNKLLKESEEKKDILFLDVTDVYRNLPQKLLQFMKWAHLNEEFSYLMKTDDDTFVNAAKVLKNLKTAKKDLTNEVFARSENELHLHWWSSFREGWPVQSSGKWREDNYRSATYPPFPCGAGYVLSRDLVQYLGNNAYNFLYQDFQGEDVSLGIWLAGTNPLRYSTDTFTCEWICDGKCNPEACNRAELSVDGMYQTWESFQRCGNFCGCHWE